MDQEGYRTLNNIEEKVEYIVEDIEAIKQKLGIETNEEDNEGEIADDIPEVPKKVNF